MKPFSSGKIKAFPYSVMTYDPNHPDSPRYTTTWHEGMDLRDYFAAKVMQVTVEKMIEERPRDVEKAIATVVASSYKIADEMMKAREQ